MSHDHPSPEKRGSVAARPSSDCPPPDKLSLLAQGLLDGPEREPLERHVASCGACAFELTRLVDERQAMDGARRHRRFPWVPVIATCTVLTACAIAWFLSGSGQYIEVTETGTLLSFSGNLELRRGKSGPTLKPEIGLGLDRGDRVRTPDRKARAYFVSTSGVLYRYDSRGETMLARLGPRVAIPDRDRRKAELVEVQEALTRAPAPHSGIRAQAPRGNILSQTPDFELSGTVAAEPIQLEIREEEPRIRIRFKARSNRVDFPTAGRPLERGRTFFWKAEGMPDEQAFFVASEQDLVNWGRFLHELEDADLPSLAARILEGRYLLSHGFHLDALRRIETVCDEQPDAAWPYEEAALVFDRLGRLDQARDCLVRARRNRQAETPAGE